MTGTDTDRDQPAVEAQEYERDARGHTEEASEQPSPALEWLEEEFPGWTFEHSRAWSPTKPEQDHWIARRDGHHPQAEASPGKLHTRLSEYLARQQPDESDHPSEN